MSLALRNQTFNRTDIELIDKNSNKFIEFKQIAKNPILGFFLKWMNISSKITFTINGKKKSVYLNTNSLISKLLRKTNSTQEKKDVKLFKAKLKKEKIDLKNINEHKLELIWKKTHSQPLSQGLEASTYTNNANKQKEWALDFFKNGYTITGNEKKVLDLGSGDGSITIKISELFASQCPNSTVELTGMDISKSMIAQAKRDYPKERYKNVSFIEGGAEDIFYRNHFDLLFSFSTLHFVLKQEKAIQQIYNSLSTDGTALILVPSRNAKNMNPLAGSLMTGNKWKKYFPEGYTPSRVYYTPEEYEKMLQTAGFASVDVKLVTREDTYPSKDAFIDSLVAVLNYVPLEIRREFAIDLADLLDPSQDSFGAIHYRHNSLQIVAKKNK